ncbi:MAG: alpha/beta hydrolase fold domain-containing protein [Jatrophihabitantaceae bacterium]
MHLPRSLVFGVSAPLYRTALNARTPRRLQRALLETFAGLNVVPAGTQVSLLDLGGRPCERITVGASERPRAILYLHGGGYTVGSPHTHRSLAAFLARSSSAVLFSLDYRLAPENPYPAALDDAVAAFRALVAEHGFASTRIAVSGDSAGGGLAVAAARRLTDDGLRPAALGLLSPWTDPSDDNMPRRRDFVIDSAWGRTNAIDYRGGADPHDPGYAPMYARLDGLPPMLIHCGVAEILQPQILQFAALAAAAGVDVQVVEHDRLWHSGHALAGTLREATDAVHDLGVFLRAHLDAVTERAAVAEVPA